MTITNEQLSAAIPENWETLSKDEILAKLSLKLKRPSFEFDVSGHKDTPNQRGFKKISHKDGAFVWVLSVTPEMVNKP